MQLRGVHEWWEKHFERVERWKNQKLLPTVWEIDVFDQWCSYSWSHCHHNYQRLPKVWEMFHDFICFIISSKKILIFNNFFRYLFWQIFYNIQWSFFCSLFYRFFNFSISFMIICFNKFIFQNFLIDYMFFAII